MNAKLPVTPLASWIAAKIQAAGSRICQEELRAYQLASLNSTLRWARQHSPFYRDRLAGLGGGNLLTSLDQIASLPFTLPADVREQGLQLLCVSQSEISRVVTLDTSGTTGQPKRIYFTREDQELTIDFFRCGMSTLAGPGDRVLVLLPGERPGSVGELLRMSLEQLGAEPVPYGLVDSLSAVLNLIKRERITCLAGVPVQAAALARYWEKNGGGWAPQRALLSTDCVSDAVVRELKRIWGCEVFRHYGMTEMGLGGGIECAAHAGYHLREADLYVEVIDPATGLPLPDGEYGEVVFTTLTRRGMPLIRYRTGDISRFRPEPCPCGAGLRLLERIRSRCDGQLRLGGNGGLTMADLDEALLPLPGIADFSAVADNGSALLKLRLCLVLLEGFPVPAPALLRKALQQIPALQRAEQAGQFDLAVEWISCRDVLPFRAEKRRLRMTGGGPPQQLRAE
ncbi:phenylacetate--CoA ligase family protein|uniref:Phenylacetate-coenzyme A ligase PaaK, adenylate-forming domain family n=1 Tax=Dendrosporobacter quercicolus TaxID=146817 RepID=A0A1G9XBQ3_9FIRM|nr:AMP-binding protein [Dendrosporobacter quercicolus]NSL49888.1 phenylacetate--CoA ligase family protein [Dendrosporobacter quercicolus DSM 1736]SDM94190.1 Phenylacetate-coenzyme A ligase PaaK, adenylate-forming domain family [Dendrosporobacter quercicolus]